MSSLPRSKKAVAAMLVAGVAAVLAGGWFLGVSPAREKTTQLDASIASVQTQITERKAELAQPKAAVRIRATDLYKLTKALPDDTDMAGVLLHLGRIATSNDVSFVSIKPGSAVPTTGYTVQPMDVVLQGRFRNLSAFIRDVRTLVRVKRGRLDARGRLFAIDRVSFAEPADDKKFPVVRADLTINAFVNGGAAPVPAPATGDETQSTTPSSPSSGATVAAGVTP